MHPDDRHDPAVMWQNVETWLLERDRLLPELLAFYPDAESRAEIIKHLGECIVDLCHRMHRAEADDTIVTLSREEHRDLLEYRWRYEQLCK